MNALIKLGQSVIRFAKFSYCLLAQYFSYEQSMMQGAAMIPHSQPIPPPHHHGHNFPPSNILATMPSAHMIAPLHQIHPQQVFIVILIRDNSKIIKQMVDNSKVS